MSFWWPASYEAFITAKRWLGPKCHPFTVPVKRPNRAEPGDRVRRSSGQPSWRSAASFRRLIGDDSGLAHLRPDLPHVGWGASKALGASWLRKPGTPRLSEVHVIGLLRMNSSMMRRTHRREKSLFMRRYAQPVLASRSSRSARIEEASKAV